MTTCVARASYLEKEGFEVDQDHLGALVKMHYKLHSYITYKVTKGKKWKRNLGKSRAEDGKWRNKDNEFLLLSILIFSFSSFEPLLLFRCLYYLLLFSFILLLFRSFYCLQFAFICFHLLLFPSLYRLIFYNQLTYAVCDFSVITVCILSHFKVFARLFTQYLLSLLKRFYITLLKRFHHRSQF